MKHRHVVISRCIRIDTVLPGIELVRGGVHHRKRQPRVCRPQEGWDAVCPREAPTIPRGHSTFPHRPLLRRTRQSLQVGRATRVAGYLSGVPEAAGEIVMASQDATSARPPVAKRHQRKRTELIACPLRSFVDEHDHHARGFDHATTARRACSPLGTTDIQRGTDGAGTCADLHHVARRHVLDECSAALQQRPRRNDAVRRLGNHR
jgi:hypothetical protein